MVEASKTHVLDTGPSGLTGHTGTDGSRPRDRIQKFVQLEGSSGECIDYGVKSPKEVIIALMVDDGVKNRGHRANIFNKGFKKMSAY